MTTEKSSYSSKIRELDNRARLRDYEAEDILTYEDFQKADELQAKANARGMKLVPNRKVKNRAKFAQYIQENWEYINNHDLLTTEEIVFLTKLMPKIGFLSNCIVDDINKKSPVPLNQKEVAMILGKSRPTTSRVIKSLLQKGVIARSVSGVEGNNVRAYALFINPNVIFSGNRDDVNPTLKVMFNKSMSKEFAKLPVSLIK